MVIVTGVVQPLDSLDTFAVPVTDAPSFVILISSKPEPNVNGPKSQYTAPFVKN